jgi:hypothetical protein
MASASIALEPVKAAAKPLATAIEKFATSANSMDFNESGDPDMDGSLGWLPGWRIADYGVCLTTAQDRGGDQLYPQLRNARKMGPQGGPEI